MADEIIVQGRVYAAIGGGYLPAQTRSVTTTPVGANVSSSTHTSATGTPGSETTIDVGACTGDTYVEIFSTETSAAASSNYLEISNGTAGSWSTFAKIPSGGLFIGMKPSGTTWYIRTNGTAHDFQVKATEI